GRAARMHELPVDPRAQPIRTDDQVAESQVAVYEHRSTRRWQFGLECLQRQLEGGADRPEGAEQPPQLAERIRRRRRKITGHFERMQAGGELPELADEPSPSPAVIVIAQDAAGGRLPGPPP